MVRSTYNQGFGDAFSLHFPQVRVPWYPRVIGSVAHFRLCTHFAMRQPLGIKDFHCTAPRTLSPQKMYTPILSASLHVSTFLDERAVPFFVHE